MFMFVLCLFLADFERKLNRIRGELLDRLKIDELFLSYMQRHEGVLEPPQKADIKQVLQLCLLHILFQNFKVIVNNSWSFDARQFA